MVKSDNVLPDPNSKVLCSIILSKFWMLTKIKNMMNNGSVFLNPNSVGLLNSHCLTNLTLDVCKIEKYDEKQNVLQDSNSEACGLT